MAEEDDGFLSRWSRRKRASQEQGEAAEAPAQPAPDAASAADAAAEEALRREENRKAAEAVDIGSLSYEDDFTLFLKDGVPGALRRRAMRRLWSSNPVLANVDGLNDYDGDFRDPKSNLSVFKSAWKVGRGYAGAEAGEAPQPDVAERDGEAGAAESRTAGDGDAEAQPELAADSAGKGDVPPERDPEQAVSGPEREAGPALEPQSPEPLRVSLRKRLAID